MHHPVEGISADWTASIKHWVESSLGPLEAREAFLIALLVSPQDAVPSFVVRFSGIPSGLITQHTTTSFSAIFARRLNELCQMPVKKAKDDEILALDIMPVD